MENCMKFVDFDEYCKHCKNKKMSENDDICNECLTISARENTHKPVNFEDK